MNSVTSCSPSETPFVRIVPAAGSASSSIDRKRSVGNEGSSGTYAASSQWMARSAAGTRQLREVLKEKRALKSQVIERVVFNAITKQAVTEAMKRATAWHCVRTVSEEHPSARAACR